jgi:uncharacterized membrane protein YidH (DUF202 family)
MSSVFEPDEPLAAERTDLAWTRSGIAFLVCVAVLLRRVWPINRGDHLLALALVAIGAIAWASGLVLAHRIAQTTHRGRDVMDPHTLRLLSGGTFVLGLGAFLLGVFPPT